MSGKAGPLENRKISLELEKCRRRAPFKSDRLVVPIPLKTEGLVSWSTPWRKSPLALKKSSNQRQIQFLPYL